MSQSYFSKDKTARGFSAPIFSITIILSLGVLLSCLYFLVPQSVWDAQISAGWKEFTTAFLAVNLVNCFVEYFFHRYILHKEAIPFLGRVYRAHHCIHHPSTRIKKEKTNDGSGREVLILVNDYPITRLEQKEASIFPWYSLSTFALLATPFFALLQWLLPALPWFFAGYGALAFSLTLYEVTHFIEHLPLSWWLPLIDHPYFGWFWTKAYGFHLYHHAVINCNEGISGFFLVPLADLVFRTFESPETLFVTGEAWSQSKFRKSNPIGLIRWLDDWFGRLEKGRRARLRAKLRAKKLKA